MSDAPSKQEIVAVACRENFAPFMQRAFPVVEPGTEFDWGWHLDCISEHLEAMYRNEIQRLLINLPPRTLKSYSVARAYPAWVMGKQPSHKFIVTSYGHEVAEQNSMACRRIMKDPWYQYVFPRTKIDAELDRNTHFETTERGQYYAATALSPITGIGCDTMIGDDLIKPMEAFSDAIRNSTNQNIRTTLMNRFNDKRIGKFLMVMQRVHEDDPTGHLLKDGGYVHLKLPAEARQYHVINLGDKKWEMQPGQLLFPERLPRTVLDQTILDMSELHYAGQYLQEPVPVGGGEFKPEWPQLYDPKTIKPKTMNVYILVDAAGGEDTNRKKKKTSDWTAMAVVGLGTDNNYYLLDMVRDRLNATERIDTLFILHRLWNEKCGRPPKVGYEKYGLMTDTFYAKQRMGEENYRFPLTELGGRMAKEERIRRIIPDMQKGRWYFPSTLMYTDNEGRSFDLIKELLESELANFPRSRHDDMIDAVTRIYDAECQCVFPRLIKKAGYTTSRADTADWTHW
jgi:predicted phage terminase large subunit-like protein